MYLLCIFDVFTCINFDYYFEIILKDISSESYKNKETHQPLSIVNYSIRFIGLLKIIGKYILIFGYNRYGKKNQKQKERHKPILNN